MEKIAIIIRGPAGAGKSTIAKILKKKINNSIHLDIDKFKHIISQDSNLIRTKISHNVGIFFINQLIKEKFNIIIEEIFREGYYNQVKDLLEKKSYKVVPVFLKSPLKKLKERDKSRKVKTKGEKVITKLHEEIKPLKNELVIDSSKNNKNNIVQIILKEI